MNLPLFSLQDQIAIVTGAAKGIGKGIAAVLRQAGATVVVADIDEAAGQATAQALGADLRKWRSNTGVWTFCAPTPAFSRKPIWPA